jgi:hypothetical protein
VALDDPDRGLDSATVDERPRDGLPARRARLRVQRRRQRVGGVRVADLAEGDRRPLAHPVAVVRAQSPDERVHHRLVADPARRGRRPPAGALPVRDEAVDQRPHRCGPPLPAGRPVGVVPLPLLYWESGRSVGSQPDVSSAWCRSRLGSASSRSTASSTSSAPGGGTDRCSVRHEKPRVSESPSRRAPLAPSPAGRRRRQPSP